ncbi:hypothetical protein GA0115254_12551, partial [Streptomyces sp. Ncost-T10-10d]
IAAKALSFAGKTGRIVDPMTYVFKGAGAGLTKISDMMAGLKGLGHVEFPPLPDNIITLPEGTIKLPDGTINLPEGATIPDGAVTLPNGTVKLPDGAVALPEGTIKSPFDEGAPYMDRDGNLYNDDGSIAQHVDQSGKNPRVETPTPVREPALVGAGIHAGENAGNHLPGSAANHTAGGGVGDNILSNSLSHETSSGHAGEDLPGSRQAEARSTGPFTGRHLPDGPTTHSKLPRTERPPGEGGLDDLGRTGDDADPSENKAERDSDSDSSSTADDQPEAADGGGIPGNGNPYAGHEPDHSRPALLPADGPLTLRDVRNTRDRQIRWKRGEELHRQMWGGSAERLYPVPTSNGPRYPVTAAGGRKVDVPVDLPDGRTIAVEVKTYGPYRTITMKDGSHQAVRNEVPLSKEIKEQINKDIALRRLNPGYDPRWAFTHAGPSETLRTYFKEAKIIFLEYGPAPKKDQWDLPKGKK